MSQNFGIAMPAPHRAIAHRAPVRYLVILDSGGAMVARMFLASRELVSECDGAATEVANMTAGIKPAVGALGAEWDVALGGHNTLERSTAAVYTLAT